MKPLFDNQFSSMEAPLLKKRKESIYVVVAKPTRVCNADCSYCSSPPLEEMGENWEPEWNLEKFKLYFDKVFPYMINGATWIWHGGEPMLMGAKFYIDANEYAVEQMKKANKRIFFSMQSNLLGYNEKWYPVFSDIFGGSVSTSFDPDEENRTIKGNAKVYSKVFKKTLNKMLDDGFRPMVIGVYKEETAHLMTKMYDWSLSLGEKSFPLRFNYCHPTGRIENGGEAISPDTYANKLIEMYDRWIKDNPNFTITPLDIMFKKVLGIDGEGHCPWTKKCGGRFIEIEPNGEVYNCSEFADMGDKYCFGNLNSEIEIPDMLNTKPALQIKRRVTYIPESCETCEHFKECEGGCMRDSALYENGLYGKFHYCKSWKMVFARIKESILSGEADELIKRYGYEPEKMKKNVKQSIKDHFDYTEDKMNLLIENGKPSIYGYAETYEFIKEEIKPNDPEFILPKFKKVNDLLKNIKIKVVS